MPPQEGVSNILQNLRGEHFRHTRNVQGKGPVSSSSLSFHAYNQPTLPIDLIYPSPPQQVTPTRRVPGPSPPRSWQSSDKIPSSPIPHDTILPNTPAWRDRALSLLFTTSSSLSRPVLFPNPGPIPSLTLLCLQLLREACPGADLAHIAAYIPAHLRRALVRYAAVHAPLSQIELDALRQGATHVDTELLVVGPHNVLHASFFRERVSCDGGSDSEAPGSTRSHTSTARDVGGDSDDDNDGSWDADMPQMQESEPLVLRSLAVLSTTLSTATLLAFPPTITHLALIDVPHRISLHRLPAVCPLLVFLDLSYNAWLSEGKEASILEEMDWSKLRRLEVVGLRQCPITPKVLLELNRGRWEDVRVIR